MLEASPQKVAAQLSAWQRLTRRGNDRARRGAWLRYDARRLGCHEKHSSSSGHNIASVAANGGHRAQASSISLQLSTADNDSSRLSVCLTPSPLTINSQAGIKLRKKQAIIVGIHKRLQHLNKYDYDEIISKQSYIACPQYENIEET
jgi:hypothetical protein